MQIVEFNKKKWAVDLNWETLDISETNLKKATKESAKKSNSNYGIIVRSNSDNEVALGLAKKSTKVPSAALYLAIANQNYNQESTDEYNDWIVVEEVGDDKYWMAVIRNGIPSPDFDKILDITSVKTLITNLLENDTFHIYSPCGEIQTIFESMKIVENKTLNDLTQDTKTKNKFVKLRGIPNGVIYSGLALVLLFGTWMTVDTFFESYSLKEKAREAERKRIAEEQRIQAEYDVKLKVYEEEIIRLKEQAEKGVLLGLSGNPNKILSAWSEAVGGLNVITNGWNMNKINCSITPLNEQSKSNCIINFERTGLTTNRMLLQDYPDADIQGDKATVSRDVITDNSIFQVPELSILNTLPDAKNWGFDMISQLQLLKIANINHKVESSADITITPPIKPLSPEEAAKGLKPVQPGPMSIGIARGQIIVNSDNFDLLRELADNVDFTATGVSSVDFTLGQLGDMKWTATFNYYIRTSAGGLIGSDSSRLSNSVLPDPSNPQVVRDSNNTPPAN